MAEAAPLPLTLKEAVTRWRAAGEPPQQPTRWSRRPWLQEFGDHADLINSLPEPITRADVMQVCAKAADTPEDALRGFIAAMVWGYGRVGYGPFRTARVLRDNPDAALRLCEAARLARDEGGPAAFRWLANNRLHHLGVAFATKFLFFCAAHGSQAPAPVLDRLVRDWLAHNAGWSPRLDWRVADYLAYVDTVCAWASQVGMKPADLELLIFTLEASVDPTSQWARPELLADAMTPPANPEDDPEVTQLLEALDEAAEAFAALSAAPEDAADFESALRLLRRIALTRGLRRG